MTDPTYISTLRTLIARDDLPAALDRLRELLAHSPKLDEALHQSGRFENIRRQIRLGTVSAEEANVARNQISAALLELVRELETQAQVPTIRAEMERAVAIVKSKNVVVGSTISATTVTIGDTHHHYDKDKSNKSVWLKIGAALVTIIGLLAGIAEFTGVSLMDLWGKEKEPPAEILQTPAPVEQETPQEQSPADATELQKQTPSVSAPKGTPRNHFESRDSSKQINIPDNNGTININQ